MKKTRRERAGPFFIALSPGPVPGSAYTFSAKSSVKLFAAAAAFRDNGLNQEQQGRQSKENLVTVLVIFHAVAALVFYDR